MPLILSDVLRLTFDFKNHELIILKTLVVILKNIFFRLFVLFIYDNPTPSFPSDMQSYIYKGKEAVMAKLFI